MSPPILYISRLLPDPVMAAARQQFQLFNEPRDIAPSWETFKAGLREADAAICTLTDRVDTALLAEPTRLKILANYAVGYNNIDLAAATAKGIVVTNTPDVLNEEVADTEVSDAARLAAEQGTDPSKLTDPAFQQGSDDLGGPT